MHSYTTCYLKSTNLKSTFNPKRTYKDHSATNGSNSFSKNYVLLIILKALFPNLQKKHIRNPQNLNSESVDRQTWKDFYEKPQ